MNAESRYLVDVIGFNQTERLLLSSIFGLAARRAPSFLQREANAAEPANLYLVDADDDAAMRELRAVQARFPAPTVLAGRCRAAPPVGPAAADVRRRNAESRRGPIAARGLARI